MTNTELIKALRYCGNFEDREGCDAKCPYIDDLYCPQRIMIDAADALEAAEQRIKELESQAAFFDAEKLNYQENIEYRDERIKELEAQNELKDGTITAMATDIGKLQAQIPKWVSAEDHLPEESGEYNVYIQMGTSVEVPEFFGSNDLSYVTSMYFKKEQKLWLDEYDEAYNADLSLIDTANDYHVTHWMPLPKKPKGAK